MVHIRKIGPFHTGSLSSDFSKSTRKTEDEISLFQLPNESGLTKTEENIDSYSTMMKTAMRDLGIVPKTTQEGKLLAHFYVALSKYLK